MRLKNLLAATALTVMGVGTACAETTTLYERGVNTAWTAADVTAWGANDLDANYGLHKTGGNGSNSASLTINPAENAIINVEAYWVGMASTGRTFAQGNCSYFNYAGVWVEENDQDKASAYSIGGFSSSNYTTFTSPKNCANRNYDISTKNWYVIKMQINTATNKLVSFTVESSDKLGTKLVEKTDVTLTGADYKKVIFGYLKTGGVNTTNNEYLKSIVITQTTQSVSTVDYTINYKFDGETIKTDNGSATVNATIDAVSPIVIEGQKYYATSGTSMTVDADNTELNVTLRKAEDYNWTVVSNQSVQVASGVAIEGENVTVALPKYINIDGTLYETSKGSDWYHRTYSFTEDNQQEVVTYNATAYTDIVYYTEAEDLPGVTTGNGNSSRTSKGLTAYGTDIPVTTLPAGAYKIYMHAANGNSASRAVSYNVGGNAIAKFTIVGSSNTQDFESGVIVLDEESEITLTSEGSQASGIDYFFIQKLASATMSVNAAAQYATFCAPFEVEVPAGVTASTVETAAGKELLTLTPVAEGVIPANTPVVLYAEAGLEAVALYGKAVAGTPATGALVGTYADIDAPAGSYILLNQNGKVGFYLVGSDYTEAPTVGANHCYLTVSAGNSARAFILDGETSAITAISAQAAAASQTIYTVGGNEVKALQQGINIVKMANGEVKKIFVK